MLKERLDLVERERIDCRPVFSQLADGARGVPREPPAQDSAIEHLAQHVENDVRPAVRELPAVNSFVAFDRIHEALDVLELDRRHEPSRRGAGGRVVEKWDELTLDDPLAVVVGGRGKPRFLVLQPLPGEGGEGRRRGGLARRREELSFGALGEPLGVVERPGDDLALDLLLDPPCLGPPLPGGRQAEILAAANLLP